MAACNQCGSAILFGGVRDGDFRFCSQKCHEEFPLLRVVKKIPVHVIDEAVKRYHGGSCPRCSGVGPVDIYFSHRVFSFFVYTHWKTVKVLSCRTCGVKQQLASLFFCIAFGWWAIPLGILVTPVQIFRNLKSLALPPDPMAPSLALRQFVSRSLAEFFEERNEETVQNES